MATHGMRLTRAGSNIIAKVMANDTLNIHFTRAAIGDGIFDYESEAVFDLEAMKSEKMTLPLEAIEKIGDGTVRLVAHATNAENYEGFSAREHGVFALDPETGAEILYSYVNVGEEYSFIPANNSPVAKDIKFSYVTIIRDAANVTATLDLSFAYTSAEEFKSHVASEHPHLNTPNHYGDIASTGAIWATDNDNHLHKISVANLKSILREDGEEKLSEQEQIIKCRDELGLNANLLLIEDFGGGDEVTDYFKSRVTSAAAGGVLIAVDDVKDLKTGAYYTISDNINAEVIQIQSVRKNASGYHCKLVNRLENSYNPAFTYLYKSTRAGSAKKAVSWRNIEFGGVSANIARKLELGGEFEIEGDGAIIDDFLTLA